MEILGFIASLIAVSTTIYSAIIWQHQKKREKRLDETVCIELIDDDSGSLIYRPPFPILRKQVSRGEVIGVLGMIPTAAGARFDISYLNSEAYWKSLLSVIEGKSSTLPVRLREDERAIFTLPEISRFESESKESEI